MKRVEAIALLAECIPVANKLAALGVKAELTDADLAALEGFYQLWMVGEDERWLDDPDIHRDAGLGLSDMAALCSVAVGIQGEKMRRQHASGEQLD